MEVGGDGLVEDGRVDFSESVDASVNIIMGDAVEGCDAEVEGGGLVGGER